MCCLCICGVCSVLTHALFVPLNEQPPEVIKILFDNKVKLVKYLEGLHKERENNDDQYRDEKQLVISTLEALEI